LKLLLGVGPTLTFVIDTTGSMSDIQASVRAQAIAMVNARLGTDQEPVKYILAPFNDPDVGPVTVTTDASAFKDAISAIGASGGGDCPEYSMTGVLQGLSAADEGGSLFLFTDASAKDSSLAGTVSSLATSKDIQVYPFLFGSCSPIDPAYTRVARESGGQLYFLGRSEAGTITRLADAIVRNDAVSILSIADNFTAATQAYSFPVDSALSKVTVSTSGTTGLVLRRPDGSVVAGSDTGVTGLALSTGSVLTITNPPAGNWNVSVSGSGDFSVQVGGESTLDLSALRLVRAGGRPGHEGFFPIPGSPLAGASATVVARLTGDFNTATFRLVSKTGATVQSLALARAPGIAASDFYGDITLPSTPFVAYVTGLDSNGKPYQRLAPELFRSQTVSVSPPAAQDLRPGQLTTYEFLVTNLGAVDSFRLTARDERGWIASATPATATVSNGGVAKVVVRVQSPSGTPVGLSDTITVSAESTSSADVINSASIQAFITSSAVGTPSLAGRVAGKGAVSAGVMYVDIEFLNSGTGDSTMSSVTGVSIRTLSGFGTVTVSGLSAALPRAIPALRIGDVVTARFILNVPTTVSRFAITEVGISENLLGGVYSFSTSQAMIP
jgi:hypothetical protein